MLKTNTKLAQFMLALLENFISGRSSGVERNLAKVEVEGSNPFARSKTQTFPFLFNLSQASLSAFGV